MDHLCKHCATPYTKGSGVDGFCCSGCRQVYLFIKEEGFEDYYRIQDRAAQPLKDRKIEAPDVAALHLAQAEVEGGAEPGQAAFEVEGMSCMGCVWLIERLAANQPGSVRAEASLSRRLLTLQWRPREFDLSAFGAELLKFGYQIHPRPRDPSRDRISPLTLRCLLTLVFAGNALLLAAYDHFVLPVNGDNTLIHLLSLICLSFTFLIGGAPFFMSIYRAFQIRRWHSDWLAVAMLVMASAYVVFEMVLSDLSLSVGAFLISLLVLILIVARCLGSRRSS